MQGDFAPGRLTAAACRRSCGTASSYFNKGISQITDICTQGISTTSDMALQE